MRSGRTPLKLLLTAILAVSAVLILDAAAWAQQESPLGPLPGQPLEHPETPIWLTLIAVAVALGALGLVVLIAGSYVFLSRRFFSKEEAPLPRRPAVRIPPGAGVPPPARTVGHPVSETTPQGAGATGTQVAAGSTATATAERPPVAEAEPAEKTEEAAEQKPEEAAEEKPAPARHSGPAELDQETFDRVRQEQLDKGASPKVAEGRAKAAAVKAAREKAGAG